jgi:hypothetical protein
MEGIKWTATAELRNIPKEPAYGAASSNGSIHGAISRELFDCSGTRTLYADEFSVRPVTVITERKVMQKHRIVRAVFCFNVSCPLCDY